MGGLIRFLIIGAVVAFCVRAVRKMLRERGEERSIPTERSGVIRKVTHHENGRMASERYLMDGVMHGPYMLWDRAGSKVGEGEYRNGMLDGTERRFGDDGRLLSAVEWKEGRCLGSRKEGADGELIELKLVKDGAEAAVDVAVPEFDGEPDPSETN